MQRPHFSSFADAVGAPFLIPIGDGTLELMLECAEELPAWSPDFEAFRLQFCGPSEPILPQATYRLQRNGDSFEIFIVPIARDGAGTHYEAIFN
jgi:hypothetical protein